MKYTKGRSSFKKKKYNRKGKRPTGFKLRRSILSTTQTRVIDLAFPIYANASGATVNVFGDYNAFPSFNVGNAIGGAQSVLNVLGSITNNVLGNGGQSLEFIKMQTLYSLARVKSASIRYINTMSPSLTAIHSAGNISLGLTPRVGTATTDQIQLQNNYMYEGNLVVQPINTSGSSRTKTYRYPMRSINPTGTNALNDWQATALLAAGTGLNLILGVPSGGLANGAAVPIWGAMAAANGSFPMGQVVVKILIEFSSPQTSIAG